MTPLAVAGSVALMLHAMHLVRDGFDRILREPAALSVLGRIRNRGGGFLAGAMVAAVAPSSTSVSVAVSRIAADARVGPEVALAVLLGANVGMTVLVALGTSGIEGAYPLLLLAGVLMHRHGARDGVRGTGLLVLGMGLVFLGLSVITSTMGDLPGSELEVVFSVFRRHPLLLLALSAGASVLMQSASVTVILAMCLAGGRSSLAEVVVVVCGANLGVVATALLVARGDPASRAVAVVNGIAKGGAAVCIAAVPVADADLLAGVPAGPAAAAVGLAAGPGLLRHLLSIRSRKEGAAIRYLGLDSGGDPRQALAHSRREILHAAEEVRAMLDRAWAAWIAGDRPAVDAAAALDDRIDLLDRRIKEHLVRIDHCEDDGLERERCLQMRYASQLEEIGDLIEKRLADIIRKGMEHASRIPADGHRLLAEAQRCARDGMLAAETAFATRDGILLAGLAGRRKHLAPIVRSAAAGSLARRAQGVQHEAEEVFLDLLSCFDRIHRSACTLAKDVRIGAQEEHRVA